MAVSESPSGGLYERVAPNLYRHSLNGRYYGVKKISGKRKERSLKTSDRQIANRRLREWLDNLHKIDSEMEKTTLRQLLQSFQSTYLGKSESTRESNQYISEKFKIGWLHGLDIEVRNIRPSQLDEWLGRFDASIKNTTYNRYMGSCGSCSTLRSRI